MSTGKAGTAAGTVKAASRKAMIFMFSSSPGISAFLFFPQHAEGFGDGLAE